jgi:hypothetical protein
MIAHICITWISKDLTKTRKENEKLKRCIKRVKDALDYEDEVVEIDQY